MTVFVAGGTGTIGVPLVRRLVAAGHHVVATTRTPAKEALIRGLGARPIVVDALDAAALARVVRDVAPTHVIHQLTALPRHGPGTAGDLEATNRLRVVGTRHLIEACLGAGVRRVVAGSFAPLGATAGDFTSDPLIGAAARAVQSMESQLLMAAGAGRLEGVVLRYGLFYGPGVAPIREMPSQIRRRRVPIVSGDRGRLPWIHLDDAVAATVAALTRGTSGEAYDIVDDAAVGFSEMVMEMVRLTGAPAPFRVPLWLVRLISPYRAKMLTIDLRLSNAPARRGLNWAPRYPSVREGLRLSLFEAA